MQPTTTSGIRRAPSVRTLEQCATPEQAREMRRVFKMCRADLTQHPACIAAYARNGVPDFFHAKTYSLRMCALSAVGGFHGVEAVELTPRSGGATEWADFLNAGDTYTTTVIRWRGAYRVQSLGDFLEVMERQGFTFC